MGIWGKRKDSNKHKTSIEITSKVFPLILENFFLFKFYLYSGGEKKSPEEYEDESMVSESCEKMTMV